MQEFFRKRWHSTLEAPGPEVLRIAVGNLWRLEAQRGLFLADHELIDQYEFTYLTFPVSEGEASEYSREYIYPVERSDLELTVDQYLYHEWATAASAEVLTMFSGVVPEDNVLNLGDPGDIGLKGVRTPPPLASWQSAVARGVRHSQYSSARRLADYRLNLKLPNRLSLTSWVTEFAAQRPDEDRIESLRRRSIAVQAILATTVRVDLGDALQRQWDAIREEPYTNEQVWNSIASTALLFALKCGAVSLGANEMAVPDGLPNELSEAPREAYIAYEGDLFVEYTSTVGYNRALVNARQLHGCLRPDIESYLPDDIYRYCDSFQDEVAQLLIAIRNPSLMFEFQPFAGLYATQVIPYSALFRPQYPLFSVVRLLRFGRP